MALKKLPGGELYEENGGSYANEETARRHEAIHRQIIGAAVSAGQEAAEVATWPKGALAGANLDTLTVPGTYWQSTPSLATVERGYPRSGMTMILRVEQAATSIVTQEAIQYDSTGVQGVWRRSVYTDGRVTAWVSPDRPGLLGDQNLTTITAPGSYYQSAPANATLERGYPRAGMLGVLDVKAAAASIVTQTYTHYDSTGVQGVYRRTVYSDGRATEWTAPAGTPTLLGTRDLSTVTTPGPYYQSAPANATVARGYPRDGMLGVLRVDQAASSVFAQEFIHYDSTGVKGVYRRTVYADGRATEWAAPAGTPTPLGTRDLAAVLTPGPYYQSLPANATTARGYPKAEMTGTLEVRQAASSLVTQEYTHYDASGVQGVYRRTVYNDGRVTEWTQTAGAGTGTAPQPTPVVPAASPKQSSRRAGGVMLRFDDAFTSLTHAAEYMAQYGMSGYLAAITRRTAQSEVTTLATRYGWEIGNHTAEHITVKDAGFLASVDDGSRDILGMVGEYPGTFTYPTGARTPQMDREMALRFNQVQLTSEPHTSAVNLAEPSFFSGWTVVDGLANAETQERAFDKMKRYVVGSTSQHLVPTVAFHEVAQPGQTPTSAGMVPWDLFTRWIDWLASQGVETILPRMLRPAQIVVDAGFNAYPVATFATGAYPWAASSLAIWSRSTTRQYSGLGCLRSASSTPVTGTVSQGLALEPGREYRVHVLADVAPTAGAVEVELRPRLMDGRYVGATIPLVRIDAATGGFKDHTMTFTMPPGTQNASLFIKAVGLAGTAVIDHVSIMRADLHDPLDPSKP